MTAWRTKVDGLKDQLAKVPGLRIVPKHTVFSLLGPRCQDCSEQIILATGPLQLGRCGRCYTRFCDVHPAA